MSLKRLVLHNLLRGLICMNFYSCSVPDEINNEIVEDISLELVAENDWEISNQIFPLYSSHQKLKYPGYAFIFLVNSRIGSSTSFGRLGLA